MFTIAPPSPCCEHLRDLVLEAERDAFQVDGEDAVELLLVEVGDRMRVGGDRGVVDRAVEPPVALDRGVDHGLGVRGAGDVGRGRTRRCRRRCSMRSTVAWPSSSLMSLTSTCAPAAAKTRAVASPIPMAAPVTIATLPSSDSCGHRSCTFLSGSRAVAAASRGGVKCSRNYTWKSARRAVDAQPGTSGRILTRTPPTLLPCPDLK